MKDRSTINKRDFLRKSILTGAGAVGATTLAAPYVKAQAPIKWRCRPMPPALASMLQPGIDASTGRNASWKSRCTRRSCAAGRAVPRSAGRHARRRPERRRLGRRAGGRRRVRRLLPVRLALQPGRAGAVALVRAEGHLGGGLWRGQGRDLAVLRLVGPVQLRHHQADPFGRRPAGPARLHVPDRRPLHAEVRRGAGLAALRGRPGGDPDRRAGRPAGAASPNATPSAGRT